MLQVLIGLLIVCSSWQAQAIEVSFSAESGGESVGIYDEYDVDAGVSVSEDSTAEFGDLNIQSNRKVSGSGDAKAIQSYSGTDCSGQAMFAATSASLSLDGSAKLKPHSLCASQNFVVSGDQADSSLSVALGDSKAYVSGGVTQGSMSSVQEMWTGSAHVTQNLVGSGADVRFHSQAQLGNCLSYIDASTRNFQGIITASADDITYVAEQGTLSGGYQVDGTGGTLQGELTSPNGHLDRRLYALSDRPFGRQEVFGNLINGIIDDATAGSVAIIPEGYINGDVNICKNLQVQVENGGQMQVGSVTLSNNARLLSGSMGLSASTVTVNSGSSINDGLSLAGYNGLVNVAAGSYSDDVNQDFYSRDITLTGATDAVTDSITLDKPVSQKISGLTARSVNVNSGASIQDGITLATETAGTVAVASGAGSGQTVDYNKNVHLAGLGSDVLNELTISLDGTGKISGFTANTANVGSSAAIQQGIDLAVSGGTVNVAAGTFKVNLVINKRLTLNGAGSDKTIIDGQDRDSTINVGTSATSTLISNVAVTNGKADQGAGIFNRGTLELQNVEIYGNNAAYGGGVINKNTGALTLVNVNIHNNVATGMGGGIYNDGGTTTLNSGSITYNAAGDGGGFSSGSGGRLYLNGGSIAYNTASNRGGGIGNWATLVLAGTTITDNTATNAGGGIYKESGSSVTLNSGSITRNRAAVGGGIGYKTPVSDPHSLVTGNTRLDSTTASNIEYYSG